MTVKFNITELEAERFLRWHFSQCSL